MTKKSSKNILAGLLIAGLLLVCIVSGCSVNNTTAQIHISNTTNLTIRNIYIGSTLITPFISPGFSYDYWAFTNFEGKLQMQGPDEGETINADALTVKNVLNDAKFTIKPGYMYLITVYIDSEGTSKISMDIVRYDSSNSTSTKYDVID